MDMNVKPGAEHRWLERLVGEWRFESSMEGEPAQACGGIERVRKLGELWVLCEGEGEMPGGGTGYTLMTLGFDPQRGRFVGSWVGSMMTWMWRYDGALDDARRVLTLETEGPSFTVEGATAKYRDAIELPDDDHRVLRSQVQREDGSWTPIMSARYTRTK